jgi:putative transposase
MVSDPYDYRWSSDRAHAFGLKARLWSPHCPYLQLARNRERRQESWRALVNDALNGEALAKIRHCANTGLVLGTETFRQQVHRLRN